MQSSTQASAKRALPRAIPSYPRPMATVDVVLFTVVDEIVEPTPDRTRPGRSKRPSAIKKLKVVLTPRRAPPHQGALSLPGTFVHVETDPSLIAAANRVLRDKCGLEGLYVEQLSTHGDARRDPRGWCVTTVYYALVAPDVLEQALGEVKLLDAIGLAGLPFDHDALVAEGVARIAGKASYTTLPALLVPRQFAMTQLEEAYEAVLGRPLNAAFFRRKMEELRVMVDGVEKPFLIDTGLTKSFGGRPATLYEKATDAIVAFPQRF
jgi:ADP-ribose pyrophosphatase YjhB (NUDIX family)